MVSTPVTTHAPSSSAGESVPRAMSASTMKMPEPIIDPMTSAVEEKSPSLCTIRGASAGTWNLSIGVISEVVTYSKF